MNALFKNPGWWTFGAVVLLIAVIIGVTYMSYKYVKNVVIPKFEERKNVGERGRRKVQFKSPLVEELEDEDEDEGLVEHTDLGAHTDRVEHTERVEQHVEKEEPKRARFFEEEEVEEGTPQQVVFMNQQLKNEMEGILPDKLTPQMKPRNKEPVDNSHSSKEEEEMPLIFDGEEEDTTLSMED